MTTQTCFSSIVELGSDCLGRGVRFFSPTKLKSQTLHPPGSPPSSLSPNIFREGLHFSTFRIHSCKTRFPFRPSPTSLFKTERQNFCCLLWVRTVGRKWAVSPAPYFISPPLHCDFILKRKEAVALFLFVCFWFGEVKKKSYRAFQCPSPFDFFFFLELFF